jgi:hypothetical protein
MTLAFGISSGNLVSFPFFLTCVFQGYVRTSLLKSINTPHNFSALFIVHQADSKMKFSTLALAATMLAGVNGFGVSKTFAVRQV